MTVTGKISTVWDCVQKPGAFKWLTRLAWARLTRSSSSLEDSHPAALRWCRERAVALPDSLRQLTGATPVSVREQFAAVFAESDEAIAACPQRMGGGAALDLLYACARNVSARRIVETGVAYGWSSLALLLALQDQPNRKLVSTNLHYREYGDDRFVGCAVPAHLRSDWTILTEPDRMSLPQAIKLVGVYDLCHYDSDKSYAARRWAYPLLWAGLRVGGCFISDDIDDNLAFAHFCRTLHATPTIVSAPNTKGMKYVGVLWKRDEVPPTTMLF